MNNNLFNQDLQEKLLREQVHMPERFLASIRSLTDDNYKTITGNGYCSDAGINVGFGLGINLDVNNTGNNFDLGTTATQLSVVSDDPNDDALSGTGAQIIFLEGLDVNSDEISETVLLDGLTPVLTANSYLRLNSAIVVKSGSTNSPQGEISITANGFTWGLLKPLQTAAQLGRYSIPRNMTFVGETVDFHGDQSTEYFFSIIVKTPNTSEIDSLRTLVYRSSGAVRGIPATTQTSDTGCIDLIIRSTKLSGAGSELSSAYFSGYLIKNSVINDYSNRL